MEEGGDILNDMVIEGFIHKWCLRAKKIEKVKLQMEGRPRRKVWMQKGSIVVGWREVSSSYMAFLITQHLIKRGTSNPSEAWESPWKVGHMLHELAIKGREDLQSQALGCPQNSSGERTGFKEGLGLLEVVWIVHTARQGILIGVKC